MSLVACRKQEKEEKPIVPVAVAPAIRGSIREIVTADAILYPRDQANIVPKISAPVRRFLVNRGAHVKQGQLLAELENRDLVAAEVAEQGAVRAGANRTTGRRPRWRAGAGRPRRRPTSTPRGRRWTPRKKLLDSRQQLLKEGALARKSVDEAQVAYAQAKAQFETAQQHLQALQAVGKQEQINTAAAQVEAAKGQYQSRAGAGRLLADPQPDQRRRHRSAAVCRRDGGGRRAAADRDGHVGGGRAHQHGAGSGEGREGRRRGDADAGRRRRAGHRARSRSSAPRSIRTARRCRCGCRPTIPARRLRAGHVGARRDRRRDDRRRDARAGHGAPAERRRAARSS